MLEDVIHDSLRERDWNSEAVAGVQAGIAGDCGVDTDDLTADVDQRTTGIPRIDRSIGLNHVSDAVVAIAEAGQVGTTAAFGRDDAGRYGEIEA